MIENVFNNVSDCRQYAISGGNPISDPTMVRMVLSVFQDCGVFVEEVKAWHNKARPDKTYANLEIHFNNANKNRLLVDKSLKTTLAANKAETKTPVQDENTPPPPPEGWLLPHSWFLQE